MAKRVINDSYQKAVITKEGEEYFITEITKDDEKRYNLTNILDALIGVEDINVTLKSNVELEPEE